jgi:hypothetical protein
LEFSRRVNPCTRPIVPGDVTNHGFESCRLLFLSRMASACSGT